MILLPFAYLLADPPILYVTGDDHDIFVPLDAGWRFFSGQLPNRDFQSPIGLFYFILHALPMQWFGVNAKSVVYSDLIVLPGMIALAAAACYRRLPLFASLAVIVVICLLMITPRFYDWSAEDFGFLADYNRQSWAVLECLLVLAFFEPLRPWNRQSIMADGVAIGLGMLFLFYMKMTFFLLAGLYFGASLFLQDGRLKFSKAQRITGTAAFAVLLCGIAVVELRYGITADYFKDLAYAGRTAIFNDVLKKMDSGMLYNLPTLTAIFLSLFLLRRAARVPLDHPEMRKHTAVIFLITSCVVLSGYNNDMFVPPLPLALIYCFEQLRRRRAAMAIPTQRMQLRLALMISAFIICIIFGREYDFDGSSVLLYNAAANTAGHDPVSADPNNPLHDLAFETREPSEVLPGFARHNSMAPPDSPEQSYSSNYLKDYEEGRLTADQVTRKGGHTPAGPELTYAVRDGYALLRQFAKPRSHVLDLDFSNPFPIMMEWPAAKGDALWWDLERTFSYSYAPPAETVFRDADIVMVPLAGVEIGRVKLLWKFYSDYVEAHYSLAAETKLWQVYQRK